MINKELHAFINKTSQSGSILGMESIVHLCEKLGNPQDKIKVIHIAGTNGKGSTGMLLQSVIMELGYKVGRYSSPAVFAYEEMFQIQGQNMPEEKMCEIYGMVKDGCDRMVEEGLPHPTIFEVETAAAYLYFYKEACDFALIEVGMGGLTDATNVVKSPIVSVITSISMDHNAFLGDTLDKIARMKAGIIKEGCPVVALKQKEEVHAVLDEVSQKLDTRVSYADPSKVEVKQMTPDGMELSLFADEWIKTKMTGYVQVENVCLARTVLKKLEELGYIRPDVDKMKQGFEKAYWPGRFETVCHSPRMIIDGAHNLDAAMKLRTSLETFFDGRTIRYIVGVFKDKDYRAMLKEVLPLGTKVYCVQSKNARALPADELAKVAEEYIADVVVCGDAMAAVKQALEESAAEDVIVAFGSLSYLAEVREAISEVR